MPLFFTKASCLVIVFVLFRPSTVMPLTFHCAAISRSALWPKRPLLLPNSRFSSSVGIQAFLEGSSQQPAAAPSQHGGADLLSRTEIHRMRVDELRRQLAQRRMDTKGTRKELLPRLLSTVQPATSVSPEEPATLPTLPQQSSSSSISPSRRYILQVKGLSSLSSSGTGVGMVLRDVDSGAICWQGRKYLQGNRSVFESEYSGIVLALQRAAQLGVRKVLLEIDHDVICKQIMGVFKVHKDVLKAMYWSVMSVKESLADFSIGCVPAVENHEATELAKKALATGKSVNCDENMPDPMGEQLKPVEKGNRAVINVASTSEPIQIDPAATYLLQFDGGARGNPNGHAGAGMVIFNADGDEIWCGWKYLDKMSNNAAEYSAILLGLRCAHSLGIRKLIVEGDSELIIRQLTGKYRVRDDRLKELWAPTKQAMDEFDSIKISHIFRHDNRRADWLANHAMDTLSSHGFEEV